MSHKHGNLVAFLLESKTRTGFTPFSDKYSASLLRKDAAFGCLILKAISLFRYKGRIYVTLCHHDTTNAGIRTY